ncbi:LOW QUALITY PROTEIN: B-cell antigen receptor complex-associated protein alpha chain [Brienomyrus brachyistius]|uniref:LOW QUALITY PROTEIN: B-cell antigen receptor complex-associated protein alpha chain n=1 Tax=Brienomyrus brachyistius TaxID=42636 RepID=UPI0020B25FE6|nr:LOW QUALITY PROTEIN: B-cell antigen receptor complex-associated protein alpha chain [Brienomyrus brachyistius]
MIAKVILFFCCWVAVSLGNQSKVTPKEDKPSLLVEELNEAKLKCCFHEKNVKPTWISNVAATNATNPERHVKLTKEIKAGLGNDGCYTLIFSKVKVTDTGFYQCFVNDSSIYTHGTFLQVYRPLRKFLNLSESAKNKILMGEGILLLFWVILPGVMMIKKTKRHHQLEKIKYKKEEENIYEGLNIDECSSAYHQIQRSQVQGPYQDVDNIKGEEIQLEKP